jgi:DNA helicase II / ATP-dependent DNA helicase PcrA
MTKDWLDSLTPEQQNVVLHGCTGDTISPAEELLVLAGAGTGKTMTLAAFAAHRINLGVDPRRILILAFNRSAAREMELRVRKMVGNAVGRRRPDFPQCGTFHAIGLQFIRRYAIRLDLEQNFAVQDRADSTALMESVLAQQKRGTEKGFPDIDTCLRIYSFRANTLKSMKAVLSDRFREFERFRPQLRKILQAYDQAKRANNVVDFDDLLTFWHRLLERKKIGGRIRGQFDYVLVDEYQDTSPLQDRILRGLRPDGRGLFLVGDDDQCIYGFRGATPAHILDRAKEAKVLRLTRSYRSTQSILDACNAVISQSARRTDKMLWSKDKSGPKPKITIVRNEWAQVRHIIERIADTQAKGILLHEQAVLARTAEETELLEAELKLLGIPFRKVGGGRFLDQPSTKAALAILSWCENPRDTVSGLRALRAVPGIDPATASRIVGSLKGRLNRKGLLAHRPQKVSRKQWAAFADLLGRLNDWPWDQQIEAIRRCCRDHRLEYALSSGTARKLTERAAKYGTRAEFLGAVSLRNAGADLWLDRTDCLTISTIHSAKGQEWKAVYVLNAVEGCIPLRRAAGPEAVEEERRILFVGITRAKRQLELIVPKRLGRVGNNGVGLARTPFIPKRTLHSFELSPVGARSKRRARPERFRLRPLSYG